MISANLASERVAVISARFMLGAEKVMACASSVISHDYTGELVRHAFTSHIADFVREMHKSHMLCGSRAERTTEKTHTVEKRHTRSAASVSVRVCRTHATG